MNCKDIEWVCMYQTRKILTTDYLPVAQNHESKKASMIIREVQAKSILSASKIYSYVINPYVGCQHACS